MLKIDDVKSISSEAGVYLMKNSADVIVYVGKAKNLKKRLTSYFAKTQKTPKTIALIKEAVKIETIIVNNELESLLLEINLIKKYKPKYNIRLKNSNYYPYIRIHKKGFFPSFEVSFYNSDNRYHYFGPYPERGMAFNLVKLFNTTFKLRTCTDNEFRHRSRPCIKYEIGACTAPCVKYVSKEEYDSQIKDAYKLISSKEMIENKISELESKMDSLSDQEKFEEAIVTRDLIGNLKNILESQIITSGNDHNSVYYLDISREGDFYYIGVFIKSDGKLTDLETYTFEDYDHTLANEKLVENFITNYFIDKESVTISTKYEINPEILKELKLKTRLKGDDEEIINLITKNLTREDKSLTPEELLKIKTELNLSKVPYKIECFDVSHFQGSSVVGAKSCLVNGVPQRQLYRKYKLKKDENNDFANMKEIVRNRLNKFRDDAFPDLIIVDGGLGQLNAVMEVMKEMDVLDIDVVGLAKDKVISEFQEHELKNKKERIVYIDGTEKELASNTVTFKVCTRVRNEAHRTAIQYHRTLRNKKMFL